VFQQFIKKRLDSSGLEYTGETIKLAETKLHARLTHSGAGGHQTIEFELKILAPLLGPFYPWQTQNS
jgi:hypothetical protein